jgi:hypothetical protein
MKMAPLPAGYIFCIQREQPEGECVKTSYPVKVSATGSYLFKRPSVVENHRRPSSERQMEVAEKQEEAGKVFNLPVVKL